MHSHSLFFQKRTVSICCACILLVVLIAGVLPYLSFPAAAAEVVSTGSCGDNLTYTLSGDGVLTISGTGPMVNYNSSTRPWASYVNDIKSVIIEDGVTTISHYAFYQTFIVSVEIPASVTSLGYASFMSSSLAEVYFLGSSLPSMDEAFSTSRSSALYAMYILPEYYDSIVSSYVPGYSNFSYYFCKFGETLSFESKKLSDFLVSSSDDQITKVFQLNCVPYSSSTSYSLSFFDNHKQESLGASYTGTLKPYDKVFQVSDLTEFANSFDVTASYTYTINKQSSYKGSARLFLHYFDADGNHISCSNASSAYDYLYSGTRTVSVSLSDLIFPVGTEYVYFYFSTHTFSGLTVSSLSFDLEMTVYSDPPTPPPTPVVNSSYAAAYSYNVGAAAEALEVTISPVSDGEVACQWYVNTVNSTTGGTPIDGAEANFYRPTLDFLGTRYYYLEVTNTLNGLTVTVYSNVCAITVSVVPPKLPTVTSHFAQSYTYKIGDAAAELVVSATVADDGVLSYQWYVFEYTGSSADNYEPIPGATSTNYQPVLDFVGTRYYMCAVTNTLSDLTVSVDSNSVMITVKPVSYTLQAGQYECKSMVAGGATVFVPLAAWPDALDNTVNLMFRSGGQSFTQFSYKYDLIGSHSSYSIYYGSIKAYAYETAANPAGFTFDAYSLLFLEADQVVPTEFYEWFVSCFEYSGADEELPTYSTIIDIYDNAGTTLLHTFLFTGEGISPVVYGFVQLDGLKLMLDSGLSYDWSELPEDEEFLGFSTRTNATAAWFIPDETFTLGGQPETAHFELYLVFNTSVPVDKEYQSGILGWLERIWDVCSETFMWSDKLYHKAEDMADELAPSVQEKQVKGFLGIIDFSGIGDFFKSAYEGMSDFFGLGSLLTGEDSPFAWLKE